MVMSSNAIHISKIYMYTHVIMPKPLFKPDNSCVLKRRHLRMAASLEQVK